MPRSRTVNGGRKREKLAPKAGLRWRVHAILWMLPPVVIIVLFIAFWPTIAEWGEGVAFNTIEMMGWGLIMVVVALAVLAGFIWRCGVRWLFSKGNRWLGALAFMAAIWGIFSFIPGGIGSGQQGGNIGLAFIGGQNSIGGLRILGLVIVGFLLVAPVTSSRLIARFARWVWSLGRRRLKAPRVPEAVISEVVYKPVARPVPYKPEPERKTPLAVLPVEPAVEEPVPAPANMPGGEKRDLRQVAQEVWKKYGEASSEAMSDGWRLPSVEILDEAPETEFSQADNSQRAMLIEDALASYGVEAKVVQINAGPTVTQFGLEPGWDRRYKEIKTKDKDGNINTEQEEVSKTRVKVDRITGLANDLALALAAPSIRIEAPIPGKSVVGIEVPNSVFSVVTLRSVLETNNYQKMTAKSKLALALGKGAGGEAIVGDLVKMPHLLIAGATGSGKTVCLNATIACLMMHNTPYDLRFVMIDPKRVELVSFNSIPHLAAPVVVETDKALGTLRWMGQEMDKRYQMMASARVRNIEGYNKGRNGKDKMPYLVLVIDELADLMMTAGDEVEHILCRLAQLARATGIHLIVATQRPSVDVITGLIKANFPTRISFAVTSQVDSRTILDSAGAEKLLGSGDMLYLPTEAGKPKRLQGCYVSDTEIERLVYFWGTQQERTAELKIDAMVPPITAKAPGSQDDPLLEAARRLAEEHEHISTSYLQRKLHIGYPRAARIMEQLQEEIGDLDDEEEERIE